MPSIITASTASNTALNFSADTSGVLEIRTGSSPTTAMTIDGSQNVGIGTTSPTSFGSYKFLTIQGANTSNGGALELRNSDNTLNGQVYVGNSTMVVQATTSHPLLFNTNGTERMRITSGGQVGIGNTNPNSFNPFANQLVVGNGSSSQGITVYASGASSISFADGTAGNQSYEGYLQYNHAVDAMDFYVNYTGSPSPRMRINSDGNLLINTITGASAVTAVKIVANSSANTALQLNTGTSGGAVFSNNTGNGFQIYGYTGSLASESYNKVMENAGVGTSIAIGGSSSVSGVGITFPATQSASSNANTLDDYEEGTWTPTLTSGFTSPTYSLQVGTYTKIGNTVTFSLRVQVSGGTRAGSILRFTLPFVAKNISNNSGSASWAYVNNILGSTTTNLPTLYVSPTTVNIDCYKTDGANFLGTDLSTATPDMYIGGSYLTD